MGAQQTRRLISSSRYSRGKSRQHRCTYRIVFLTILTRSYPSVRAFDAPYAPCLTVLFVAGLSFASCRSQWLMLQWFWLPTAVASTAVAQTAVAPMVVTPMVVAPMVVADTRSRRFRR